jgi:hypothetical protein
MSALVAAEQHDPVGAAHLALLAGVVVIAIAIIGVSRWRAHRGEAAAGADRPTSRDPGQSTPSTDDE